MNSHEYAESTREELILLAAEIVLAIRLGKTTSPDFTEKAERLARLYLTFDDWLARGGTLPLEWKRD